MIAPIAWLPLVVYLPGAILMRVPYARARREQLDADERLFWCGVLSVTWSLAVGFVLAALRVYTYDRLLLVNGGVTLAAALAWRGRLRYRDAVPPRRSAIVPLVLAACALWLFQPPSEYIVGGRDPGVYMNTGVQIAQQGRLIIRDTTAAALPQQARPLFFPQFVGAPYYSPRFMGFYLLDPDAGTVVDQFPHLYPVAIAIGYGTGGLTGAREITVVAGVLGILALYFLTARLAGRSVGVVAAGLLAIHVVDVWYSRYPNSEVLTQALGLAGLLATARAHVDDDGFFAPVAGVILGMLPFARIDAVIMAALACSGVLLLWLTGNRLRWSFWAPVVGLLAAFLWYLMTWLAPYAVIPQLWFGLHRLEITIGLPLALFALLALRRLGQRPAIRAHLLVWAPRAILVLSLGLGLYAWFLRQPGGKLAAFDAYAFRTYGWYVPPAVLIVAAIGLTLLLTSRFWRDPAFFCVFLGMSGFVFYRLRIVPEHFWAARRFLPVILPGTMVAIAAVLTPAWSGRPKTWLQITPLARQALRLVLLGLVARSFWMATTPILGHVEYAGVILRLERLASRFGGDDLLVFESRNASDLHVLGLPLAYIYGKPVLVLSSPRPDTLRFADFLRWARPRYRNVYFLGGGGTSLLSREIAVQPVDSERFQVPEYEALKNAYPTHVRRKEFDFGVYRFVDPVPHPEGLSLDIGTMDDLYVVRFHAKERDQHGTFRWTGRQSYVSLVGITDQERALVLRMSSGRRPDKAGPAEVEAFIGPTSLGKVVVGHEWTPFTFEIPPALASEAAGNVDATLVRLVCTTWNPRAALGWDDDRDLGVMVDHVELRRVAAVR